MVEQKRVQSTRDIDQNAHKSLNGSLMSVLDNRRWFIYLMNLMLDCCDECVNLCITHLVNLWLCWGRRIERNFWNKDSLRNKICYSSSFSLKKKKMQQTYIIFSNDKLIIRSTISIMCFIFKIFVVQLVSLNVSNKNIQSSNLIFSLLYIWIIKLLRNENIRDVHIGNTTKVWTFSFFFL